MTRLKQLTITSMLLSILLIAGCGEDTNPETSPLKGKIEGGDWTFKYAKSIFNGIDDLHEAELYGTQQDSADPCSVFISSETHLSIIIPNAVGNYQVPSDLQVVFELAGSSNDNFRATSGFVEVTEAAGGIIVGYMQASYDDDNTVEGTFSFSRCN